MHASDAQLIIDREKPRTLKKALDLLDESGFTFYDSERFFALDDEGNWWLYKLDIDFLTESGIAVKACETS